MAKRYTGELDRNNLPITESVDPFEFKRYKSIFDAPVDETPVEQTESINPFQEGATTAPQVGVGEFEHPYYEGLDNEERRAQEQSGFVQLGSGLANAVTGTLADMGSGVSYLLDWEQALNLAKGTEDEFGNWFSQSMDKFKEETELPVYRTEWSKGFNPASTGWWAENMPSIASTIALMVPAIGATEAVAAGAKALKGAEALSALGAGINEARAIKGISSALISRYMENTMEAAQTMKSLKDELLQKGYSEEEATNVAADAARQNWMSNSTNLMFDIPQYMLMFTPIKAAGKAAEGLSGMSRLGKLGIESGLEGVEEARQFISDKEAQRDALLRAKLEKPDDSDYAGRVLDYAKDPEFWTSTVLGTLGGAMAGGWQAYKEARQDRQDRVAKNLVNQTLEKQRAVVLNDKTKFDESDDKAFIDMLYDHAVAGSIDSLERDLQELKQSKDFMENLSEDDKKDVITKINNRLEDIQTYKKVRNKVELENLSPELKAIKTHNQLAQRILDRRLEQTNKSIDELTTDDVVESVLTSDIASVRNMQYEQELRKKYGMPDPALDERLTDAKKAIFEDDIVHTDINNDADLQKKLGTSRSFALLNQIHNKLSIEKELKNLVNQNAELSSDEGRKKIQAKLDENKAIAKRKQQERLYDAVSTKLAQGKQLTPEEQDYYASDKERVDARVQAKKAAMDDDAAPAPKKPAGEGVPLAEEAGKKKAAPKKKNVPTQTEKDTDLTSYKIQQYGTNNEITVDDSFTVTTDENGFPVYTDSKGTEYKRTEGWFAMAATSNDEIRKNIIENLGEEFADHYVFSGPQYFSTLWEFQLREEKALLEKVFTKLHDQDPVKYATPEAVVAEFPDAFPSIRGVKINEKLAQLPKSEWSKFVKIIAGKFYPKSEEAIELPNTLEGRRPAIDIILQVTDPETGEVAAIHHPRYPGFFSYTDLQGNPRSVDFSTITKEEFDALFLVSYSNPRVATIEDFEMLTSEWARADRFFKTVQAYFEMQSQMPGFSGQVEYNLGEGYDLFVTGQFLFPDKKFDFPALDSIPGLKDAPIINMETKEMVRGEMPSDFTPATLSAHPNGYYAIYTHPTNGYRTLIRLSPKKFDSVDEVLSKIEDVQRRLLEIPKDLVMTDVGDKMANQIVKEIGVFIASRDRMSLDVPFGKPDFRNISFSVFRSSKTNTYLLQIETELDNVDDADAVKVRFIFADDKNQVKIYGNSDELERALKKRGLNLNMKKDFRKAIPQVFPADADINSYFDSTVVTDPETKLPVKFGFRFSFPEVGVSERKGGLPGFNLPEVQKTAQTKTSKKSKKQIADKTKGGEKDALKQAILAEGKKGKSKKAAESKKSAKRKRRKSDIKLSQEEAVAEKGLSAMAESLAAVLQPAEVEELKKEKEQAKAAKKTVPVEEKPVTPIQPKDEFVFDAEDRKKAEAAAKEQKAAEKTKKDTFPMKGLPSIPTSVAENIVKSINAQGGSANIEEVRQDGGFTKEEADKFYPGWLEEVRAVERTQQAKKKADSIAKRSGRKNMLSDFAVTEPSSFEEAAEIVKRELPESISVEEMNPLLERTLNGKIRLGFVIDNMVYLSRKATKKTGYHEAMHIVLDALLPDAKLASYRRLAKEEMDLTDSQLAARIAKLRATGDYEGVSDSEMENLVYDEYIADQRAEYSAKRAGKRSVWTKLFDFIQRVIDYLTGNKSLRALYRKVERGGFSKSEILRKSDIAKNELLGTLSGAETRELIAVVAGNYLRRLGNNETVTIDDVIDEFAELYDPYNGENTAYLQQNPDQEDTLKEYYYILEDSAGNADRVYLKNSVDRMVKNFITELDLEEKEVVDEINEEDIQEDRSKEQAYDRSVYENDPNLGLSGQLKAFFGTTVYLSEDRFGNEVYMPVDPSTMYAKLLPVLSSSATKASEVINVFGEYAKSTEDAAMLAVYERLIRETGYSAENPDGTSEAAKLFLNRFKEAFDPMKRLFVQVSFTGSGFKIYYLNKAELGTNTYNSWFSNYQDSPAHKLIAGRQYTAQDKALAKELVSTIDTIVTNWKPDATQEQLLIAKNNINKLFTKLGFVPMLNDSYLSISLGIEGAGDKRDYKKVTFLSIGTLKGIKSALQSGTDLFSTSKGGRKGVRGSLKRVAQGNAVFSSTDVAEITPNFKVGDKTYYSYAHGDLILRGFDDLKLLTIEHIQALKRDPYYRNNPLMQLRDETILSIFENLHVANVVSIKDSRTNNLVLTGSMDRSTAAAVDLGLFSNPDATGNNRLYHLQQFEGKNTQYYGSLPRYTMMTYDPQTGFGYSEQAQDMLFKMFIQETERMADTTSGYLANKGKNGPQRVYFQYMQGYKLADDFLQNPEKYRQEVMTELLKGWTTMTQQYVQILQDFRLENTVSKKYLEETYNSPKELQFEHFVGDMILNDFLFTNGILQLVEGDAAWAKNIDDFVKRGAGSIAAGPMRHGKDQVYFVKDPLKFYDEEYQEASEGNETKINDGTVYTVTPSLIKDLIGSGRISTRALEAWRRLENPLVGTGKFYTDEAGVEREILRYKPLTPEEIKLVDAIAKKEAVRGRTDDGKELYLKMSEVVLTKTYTSKWSEKQQKWVPKNPAKRTLHNYREFLEAKFNEFGGERTVRLATKSAAKLYFPDNAADPNFEPNAEVPSVTIDNKFRIDQVVNETKGKTTIPTSLQVLGISGSELLDPESVELKRVRDTTFNKIKDEVFDTVAAILRKENADGTISPANLEIFLNSKRAQVQAAQNESQLLEMLEADPEGAAEYSFNLPHLTKKIESLLITSFKEAFRHQISGNKFTFQSSHGDGIVVEVDENGNELRIITEAEQERNPDEDYTGPKYKTRNLLFMRPSADGKTILPAEIKITRKTAAILGVNVTDPSKADYMKVIISRTPNQNYHSNAVAQVVDFLPEEYGDTIVGPHQLVLMTGADFDIDSFFAIMQDLYKNKNGKVIRYGEEITEEDKYAAWKGWWFKNNKFIRDHFKTLKSKDAGLIEIERQIRAAKKESEKLNKELSQATQDYIDNLESDEVFEEFDNKLADLKGEIKNLAKKRAALIEGLKSRTLREFSKPDSFEAWQAKGSPESVGSLNNKFFDAMYGLFSNGKLWPAYKDFLKDTAITPTLNDLDIQSEMIIVGNSIPQKNFAQSVNTASKDLRGQIVSATQFGLFARETGLKLSSQNSVEVMEKDGSIHTIEEYPTISPEMYSDYENNPEVIQALEKVLRDISDVGSQMVGIVIDDVKSPKIWMLNWNRYTLSEIADSIALGMDPEFVFRLFALPVFKKVDLEITNRARPVAPVPSFSPKMDGKQAAYAYYQSILNTINKYVAADKDSQKSRFTDAQYAKLTTAYQWTREHFFGTEKNSKDNMMNFRSALDITSTSEDLAKMKFEDLLKEYNFYALQLHAMDLYEKMSQISDARSETMTKLSALNKTNGSTLADGNAYIEAYDAIVTQGVFTNLGEIVDDSPVINGNVERVKKLQDIAGLYFVTEAPFFKDMFKNLKNVVRPLKLDRAEYVRRLGLIYMTSVMYRNAHKGESGYSVGELMDLMRPGSAKALTIRFTNLRRTYPELANNGFLKLISIKPYSTKKTDEDAPIKSPDSVLPLNFLIFDSFTKLPVKVQQAAMDGHASMLLSEHEEVRQFAEDIIPYLMAKDGLAFTSNSLAKLVDIYQFKEISNLLQDLMASDKEGREALYGKSEEQVGEEFVENFLRTKQFENLGYLNFLDATRLNKKGISISRIKGESVFTVRLNKKTAFDTIQKTLKSIKTGISAKSYTDVTFPKYMLWRVKVANGMSRTYRGKLVKVSDGVATYDILEAFKRSSTLERTTQFFTPEENEAIGKAMASGKFAEVELDTNELTPDDVEVNDAILADQAAKEGVPSDKFASDREDFAPNTEAEPEEEDAPPVDEEKNAEPTDEPTLSPEALKKLGSGGVDPLTPC